MSLRIDDDRLRRKLEEKELNGQNGMNPVQGPQGQQGAPQNGGVTESGISVEVVEDAKQTDIFSAAKRAQSTDGAGAASVGAPTPQDPGSNVQFDGVPNQPTGDITVQPPNTSGQQVLTSSLKGAENNDSAKNEEKQQHYQTSQEANLESVAFSGNGENTAPLADGGSGLNERLGITGGTKGTGEATLSTDTQPGDVKNTGEATLSTDNQPGDVKDTGGTNGANGADNPNEVDGGNGKNGNVNESGNKDDKNDSSNGDVDKNDPSSQNYDPNNPNNPNNIDNPNNPNSPDNPDNPNNPNNPNNPDNPENQDKKDKDPIKKAA